MKCNKCGFNNQEESTNCIFCGESLNPKKEKRKKQFFSKDKIIGTSVIIIVLLVVILMILFSFKN